jgi:hypothetical protein
MNLFFLSSLYVEEVLKVAFCSLGSQLAAALQAIL